MKSETKNASTSNFRGKLTEYFPLLLLLFVYCFFQFSFLNLEFWNDEMYTLKSFILTSFSTIITDYHVPNNHVFFSILSFLYVKVFGLTDLYSLMDSPYKLRLLPLLFSFITLFFVYKAGKDFFSKKIAILSVIILVTTLPFYNFALQIRGYGLSTMLLSAVVYFYFFYIKKKNLSSLIGLSTGIALLIYTIPSNLYVVLGMLAFQGMYLALQLINRKHNFSENQPILKLKQNLYLATSIIIGILFSLVLYAPIFADVFTNSYVETEGEFEFSSILNYFPGVVLAFTSGRWLLILLFFAGLALNFKEIKKHVYSLLFIVTAFLVPFILTFLHRDSAPFRVFELLVPLFCLLLSLGIMVLWEKFVKANKWNVLIFIFILGYSGITYVFENIRIGEKQLNYIKAGEKCQDLTEHYYLKHYHPLKDLKVFKEKYYNDSSIVVVAGCEPHDLTDYLDKLNIRYVEGYLLDTMLAKHTQVYVVTNFPEQKNQLEGYNRTFLNEGLAFYNILQITRNKELYNEISTLTGVYEQKYKDSVVYIYYISNAYLVEDFYKAKNSYILTESYKKKVGELIHNVNSKPYVCYVCTKKSNIPSGETIQSIINDTHGQVIKQENKEKYTVTLSRFEKDKMENGLINDYEKKYPGWSESHNFVTGSAYAGNRCEKLDSNNIYSSTLELPYKELSQKENACFEISFYSRFNLNKGATVVLEVNRNGTNYVWLGEEMNPYFTGASPWKRVIVTFKPDKTILPDDMVKIYIWNHMNNILWIDNLKVVML